MRVLYRVRQFWRTVFLKTEHLDLEQARSRLTPAQWSLFRQLQIAEQDHALQILRKLLEQGENQPDLLVAALLHDVGKLRYAMNPLERVAVVLVKALLPGCAKRWGQLPTTGWSSSPTWRKPFILADQHAAWGAQMAKECGTTPLAETLIRNHHFLLLDGIGEMENGLLRKLWLADNEY